MDLELAQEVMKERLERYEWNQDRAVPRIPNQEESRSRRME